MAFPKKGLRKITVDDVEYGYKITGDDRSFVGFSIGLLNQNGEVLTGALSYHENRLPHFNENGEAKSWSLHQRIKVTPNTIRQVIEYGLKNGWNPTENKGQMSLGNVDDKIELNLKEATRFPKLKQNQVALHFTKIKTGHPLDLNLEAYPGEGEIYHVFDSIEEASTFAREKITNDSEMEGWIMMEENKAVKYIGSAEETEFN